MTTMASQVAAKLQAEREATMGPQTVPVQQIFRKNSNPELPVPQPQIQQHQMQAPMQAQPQGASQFNPQAQQQHQQQTAAQAWHWQAQAQQARVKKPIAEVEKSVKANLKYVYEQIGDTLAENRRLRDHAKQLEVLVNNLTWDNESLKAENNRLQAQVQRDMKGCTNEEFASKLAELGLEVHEDGSIRRSAVEAGHPSGLSTGDVTAAQRQTDGERATVVRAESNVKQTISIKPASENGGDETNMHSASTAAGTGAGSMRNDSQDLATPGAAGRPPMQVDNGDFSVYPPPPPPFLPPPGMAEDNLKPIFADMDTKMRPPPPPPAGLAGLVAFNSAQSHATSYGGRPDDLQYSASWVSGVSAAGAPPALPRDPHQQTPTSLASLEAMSVHKIRLLELCHKHGVDLRTIEWFALPENSIYWETLSRKLEEIDRRSTMGEGHFKVKNPSAWLTKFFNTIKKHPENYPGGPSNPFMLDMYKM